jgi:hypothetical protein
VRYDDIKSQRPEGGGALTDRWEPVNYKGIHIIRLEKIKVNQQVFKDSAVSPIMKGEEGHKQGARGKIGWTSFSGQKCWQKRCFGATSRGWESNKSVQIE